jgi:hypothetical protein
VPENSKAIRLEAPFPEKGGVSERRSSGRPTVLTDMSVENIRTLEHQTLEHQNIRTFPALTATR